MCRQREANGSDVGDADKPEGGEIHESVRRGGQRQVFGEVYFFRMERKVFSLEESSGAFSGPSEATVDDILRLAREVPRGGRQRDWGGLRRGGRGDKEGAREGTGHREERQN